MSHNKFPLRISETILNVEATTVYAVTVAHEFGLKCEFNAQGRDATLGFNGDDSGGID
jgi:hypothetical protein